MSPRAEGDPARRGPGRRPCRLRNWLALGCLQGLAFVAAAQQPYVTAGIGRASWDFDCGPNGCSRNTTAWRAGLGWRFNRIVALEAFYLDFGRARSSDYSLDGSFGGSAVGLQVLLGWQDEAFELAGKLGLADARSDFRASATSSYPSSSAHHSEFIGGLMAAYRVTPSLSIRLDVDLVTLALVSDAVYFSRGANVTTLLLGASYRF